MTQSNQEWPHAPSHKFKGAGTYFVTGGTYHKEHYFQSKERLDFLTSSLLTFLDEFGWQLDAWAVFSNHYHFVARSPINDGDAKSLCKMISKLHSVTAIRINKLDGQPGRKIWHNYFDVPITHQASYFARLNYVHHNAVKHGLVKVANEFPWCSAGWFERSAVPSQVRTIYGMKYDKINVEDGYNPVCI